MKKLIILLFCLLFGVVNTVWADNSLSGDEKLACEMALCLPTIASPPIGCENAARKWHSLIKKGKNPFSFMRKCPLGSDVDDNDTSQIQTGDEDGNGDRDRDRDGDGDGGITGCSASSFNKLTEIEGNKIRTITEIPSSCKDSANLPKYICDKEFYEKADWERGYETEKITKFDYEAWLAAGNEGDMGVEESCSSGTHLESCEIYYKRTLIVKECWVDLGDDNSWGLSLDGIKSLIPSIGSNSSSSGSLSGNSTSGSGNNGNSTSKSDSDNKSAGDKTGTETNLGSSYNSGGSSAGSSGFGGMFSGSTSSAGGDASSDEDDEEDEEGQEGNVSSDEYKEMSDFDNYGNYTAIVRQVLEGESDETKTADNASVGQTLSDAIEAKK